MTTLARFTVAYWCVLIAALLPILCAAMAKYGSFGKPRHQGGYDNQAPREWLARQSGWRARANAAQTNSFEGLPFFIGAVLMAHQLGAPQAMLDVLAFLYIVLRMVYILLYVSDQAAWRSIVWMLALGVNIGIVFVGYR
jgi:uncharacterized MAPEG superfamily protein